MNVWAGKPVALFSEHVFAGNDYVNFLECLVESMDTRWRGVKGGGKDGSSAGPEPGGKGGGKVQGSQPGSKGGGPEPGAKGGGKVPGAKGGGKVEESQPGSKGGGKGQEGTVQEVPAAGNKVFQGDFVEKMMKGEFATGPAPSAEPAAATSHMAAPGGKEPAQGGKGGSQGGWHGGW